ncbi:Cyclin/Brf1-like TBP-binding protein [Heracleum sosnowskyi]|uniref:Cyclin/Brf1-like TBP-binding protein n=1 Tax=Heracleum sosnowskyi TaxID=360622 RepID=A0AAD8MAQ7_9APIA|nr:Cyclin/Brf1-like TBP-binding protein [Heracleum sosnowskyi]
MLEPFTFGVDDDNVRQVRGPLRRQLFEVYMKMNKSCLVHLLLLLLAFSLLLSATSAVPSSRSLKSMKDVSALQDLHADEVMGEKGELIVVEEFAVEGRMDLESTDYPGTGANNRHDPRSPGRI